MANAARMGTESLNTASVNDTPMNNRLVSESFGKPRRPLLGLLNYSYFAARSGLVMIFATAVLFGITYLVGIVLGAGAFPVLLFPLIGLLLMAGPIFSVMSNSDRASGWTRYQAAMPVSRQQLVAAKYLPALLVTGAATALWLALIAATRLLDVERFHTLSESGQWVTTGTMVVIVPLLAAAVYLPLASVRRSSGGHMPLLVLCLIGAFAGSQFLYAAVGRFLVPGWAPTQVLLATIALTALMLLISYLITARIYIKTSF